MTTNIVTSCSLDGWNKYGKRFVETFIQYWPTSCALHVVSEDFLPHDFKAVQPITFWSLKSSASWLTFQGNNVERLWVHGQSSSSRPPGVAPRWRENSGYNFRMDAYKFCKKVFAIELIAEHVKTGRLCWFDADVVSFANVPETLPVRLLPANAALSCLSRVGYHSECGFVGYNLDNSSTLKFIKAFSGLYHTEEVFNLAEWHDSWVFDWLRNKMMMVTYGIPHKSKGHPFINSELGLYLDHLKGARKSKGRSQAVEQLAHRNVPYWQGGRV